MAGKPATICAERGCTLDRHDNTHRDPKFCMHADARMGRCLTPWVHHDWTTGERFPVTEQRVSA